MTSADPTLWNIICVLGILLVAVAAGWPIIGPLLKRRKQTPEVDQESVPAPGGEYVRLQLSREQEAKAQAAAMAMASAKFNLRVKRFHDLIVENVRLTDEVNSHRRFRGIVELPVHPIHQ